MYGSLCFWSKGYYPAVFPHLFPTDALTLKAQCCSRRTVSEMVSIALTLGIARNPLTERLCVCHFFHLSFFATRFNMQRPLCSGRCSYDFVIYIDLCFICSWTIFGRTETHCLFICSFHNSMSLCVCARLLDYRKAPEEKVFTIREQ